jgi:hypothetical protein
MRLVLVVALGVFWTDGTILVAILTLYAGLLTNRIFPENYPRQRLESAELSAEGRSSG